MDLETAAKRLIDLLDAEVSKKNVDAVVRIMKTLVEVRDASWEKHITNATNTIIAYDNFSCDCGRRVIVERNRTVVYTDIQ